MKRAELGRNPKLVLQPPRSFPRPILGEQSGNNIWLLNIRSHSPEVYDITMDPKP